jgi:hypothetical protein
VCGRQAAGITLLGVIAVEIRTVPVADSEQAQFDCPLEGRRA